MALRGDFLFRPTGARGDFFTEESFALPVSTLPPTICPLIKGVCLEWPRQQPHGPPRYGTRANEFTPDAFKQFVISSSRQGATFLGGCCEVKPRHIEKLKNIF